MDVAAFLDADKTMYMLKTEKAYKAMFNFLSKELNQDAKLIQRVWREHLNNILLDDVKKNNPEFRKREHILHLTLGQFGIVDEKKREKIIEDALKIFWERVAETIKRKKGLKKFLEFCKREGMDVGIFTEEFYDQLSLKMEKALGQNWEKWFKVTITPEKTGVMKPNYKYYELMLGLEKNVEKIFVVGDSWQRDLEPAKKISDKFVTILINDEFSGNPDYFARDFYDVLEIIKDSR